MELRYRENTKRSGHRKEFSKILFWGIAVFVIGITVFSCALMWRTGDTSGLAYLIPSAFTELATATGFYFYKARAENLIKLRALYGKLADGIDDTPIL